MKKILHFFGASLLLLFLSGGSSAFADAVGVVTHLSGVLSVKRADGAAKMLSVNSQVFEGDTLSTEANAFARIRFIDQSDIVMRPKSQFVVEKYQYKKDKPAEDRSSISLLKGGLRVSTGLIGERNRDNVELQTPVATIGIRGTIYDVYYEEDKGLYAHVVQGEISVNTSTASLNVGKDDMAHVPSSGGVPVPVEDKTGEVLKEVAPPIPSTGEDDNTSSGGSAAPGGMGMCSVR